MTSVAQKALIITSRLHHSHVYFNHKPYMILGRIRHIKQPIRLNRQTTYEGIVFNKTMYHFLGGFRTNTDLLDALWH